MIIQNTGFVVIALVNLQQMYNIKKYESYRVTLSYFEGMYHISPKKDLTLENLKIEKIEDNEMQKFLGKPKNAFWLAKGLSWHNWATRANFKKTGLEYLYRVKLKPTARILQIEGGKKVPEEFLLEPYDEKKFYPSKINFVKISKKYDGVAAYNLMPGTYWDVPTVAIFNKGSIRSIENLGTVNKAKAKRDKSNI
jgi:hypothetical protein